MALRSTREHLSYAFFKTLSPNCQVRQSWTRHVEKRRTESACDEVQRSFQHREDCRQEVWSQSLYGLKNEAYEVVTLEQRLRIEKRHQ